MPRLPKIMLSVAAVAFSALLASSAIARAVVVHLWPAERFDRCTDDPRVFCEPGSERFARTIATLLPAAIAQVEQKQYGAFVKPIKIYTFSSIDTYALYAGTRGGAGAMSFGAIHLAPKMQAVPDQTPSLLAHELAHLQLAQRAGALAMLRTPTWFTEGWATLTSNGGGAGGISAAQAVFALVHGRHFMPRAAESLLSRTSAADFKLSDGMYYRQASLFVDYLQRRDRDAFMATVHGLETGRPFGPALQSAYGQPLSFLWQDFQADLRQRLAER